MTNPTTTKEALEPCPLAHPVVNGVRFTNFSNNVKAHIWCYDCGLEFEGRVNEPRDKVAERWNSRIPAPIVAPPNHALAQLLEAALLHPESAEGNIRQVIEVLSAPASTVAPQQSKPTHDYAVTASTQCANCGGGIADYWTYCHHCGADREEAPAAPAALRDEAETDSCSHWREGDSDNCVWCGVDLGPTTEADVAATTPPSTLAKAAADEIVPDCLSRTCFIRDCHRNHCWGCDDAREERERVATIIERCLAGGGESTQKVEGENK